MLIERNQVMVGLVMAVVVVAATAFALVTTGSTVLVRGMRMTAEFNDAAGLESGNFVFVSGVRTGTVTKVEQEGDHVLVEFALTTDAWIPNDSEAAIVLTNTLGKRGLALRPGTSTEPFVEGDRVERTRQVVDLPEFGDRTEELLSEVDVDALSALSRALGDITEGQRADVDRLLSGVQDVSEILVTRREQLSGTLASARRLAQVLEGRDDELVQIIDNVGITLDTLIAKQDDIRRLLRETANTSTLAADLVGERRAQIDRLLESLSEDLAIIDGHQVDVAHMLAYAGVALDGFSTIGYVDLERNDTASWGNVFTTGIGPIGLGASIGCAGAVDELLEPIFGPDPQCDGIQEQPVPPKDDGGSNVSGPASFFRPGLVIAASGSGSTREVQQ